jgi:hypothetical protein
VVAAGPHLLRGAGCLPDEREVLVKMERAYRAES